MPPRGTPPPEYHIYPLAKTPCTYYRLTVSTYQEEDKIVKRASLNESLRETNQTDWFKEEENKNNYRLDVILITTPNAVRGDWMIVLRTSITITMV